MLKVWNKHSKPDISKQFKLLSLLHEHGLPISKPLGFGVDQQNNQVLLMSYDGEPISKLNKNKLLYLAEMIVAVHSYKGDNDDGLIPTYDFVSYFFPDIQSHHDLSSLLTQLLSKVELSYDMLIHGDYNLGNILEDGEKLTIIDWTNGQYGDARYDIAWSLLLMKIYCGARYGDLFRKQFSKLTAYTEEELEIFEAIGCIRLLLLSRNVKELLIRPAVSKRLTQLIQSNSHLSEQLLINSI